jgi:hypothetical protein
MTARPMQEPGRQPLGFWTARAGEAIRARTRGALAEIGVSQPQWWVLHQLSLAPDGARRGQVVETVGPNESDAAIEQAIDAAVAAGWVAVEGDTLRLTAEGAARFHRAAQIQEDLQRERMQGITEVEFTTAITVLQRTITNVGGDAWHW